MNIPSGYQTVMPYLIVKDAAKFSAFTQSVFKAEEKIRHMRDEKVIMHNRQQHNNVCRCY